MPRRIVIASNNVHKIRELRRMLAGAELASVRALEVASASELGVGTPPEIDETSDEFVGNALLKANGIAAWLRSVGAPSDDLVLADDSGLCVAALDDGPGVYSARFAGPSASDEDNNTKLVAELRARGLDASPGHYVCVLAVRPVGVDPRIVSGSIAEGTPSWIVRDDCVCIEGQCHGTVRTERRGDGGFGYDPHFWIDGDRGTFAELDPDAKAERSHRGVAMRTLVQVLPRLLSDRFATRAS